MQRLLILDAGGVVVRNGLSAFFAALAPLTTRDLADLRSLYLTRLRERSQRGQMPLDEFWSQIAAFGRIDLPADELNARFVAALEASVDCALLDRWNDLADLWLLSNHRTPWLQAAMGTRWDMFSRHFVSSDTGHLKPEQAAFAQLTAYLDPYAKCLFVDDKPRNVEAMKRFCGIDGIVADVDGEWIARVDDWLHSSMSR
jgi:FMN phosphatase YigB (HAD superfamily)